MRIHTSVCPEGEETWAQDVEICVVTPKWLAGTIKSEGYLMGGGFLIVEEYNWPRIRDAIEDEIDECCGETWEEIAKMLPSVGRYEFERHIGSHSEEKRRDDELAKRKRARYEERQKRGNWEYEGGFATPETEDEWLQKRLGEER